jgi:MFS transporter, DHA3 family, macrolide efflux protein
VKEREDIMATIPKMAEFQQAPNARNVYRQIFGNRMLMLVWSGQTVSNIGDVFFNIVVMWVVYQESGSALQTALIQVVWHLSALCFGPFAGALADRWNRKNILVVTNILSGIVVGIIAAIILARGQASPVVIFTTIFLLNSLGTFAGPALFSVLPELVGRTILTTATGLFSTVKQTVNFVGSMLAGFLIAIVGAGWAVMGDALSFLVVACAIGVATLPKRTLPITEKKRGYTLVKQIREGWEVIAQQPIIRALVWFSILINVASFLGPLYPALISQRLQGGAEVYGILQAVSIIGGALGGLCVGVIEKHLGAGRLLAVGWGIAGLCTIGAAFSTWVPLTLALEVIASFCMTMGGVAMGSVTPLLIPENFRGRVQGIRSALAIIAIPISSLLGGWATDTLGVLPVFAFGGAWVIMVAVLAWTNTHVRTCHL